jgi:hypothetical protein
MHTINVSITLLLPQGDHDSFTGAIRILRRIMGRKAPDIAQLMLHQLTGRDAEGVADEYLDSIGWPAMGGRSIPPLRRGPARRANAPRVRAIATRRGGVGACLRTRLADPSRN